MKTFVQTLAADIDSQLEFVHRELEEPIQYAEQAVKILVLALEKLKSFMIKYKFESKEAEIEFFRETKPHFASKLIFYNEIYNIESNKPFGTAKSLRKYYNSELYKLKGFVDDNIELYRYLRKGNRYLDHMYFTRGQHDIRLTLDSFYLQADNRFSTSHDYKVARIIAHDQISAFIEMQLSKITKNGFCKENGWSGKPLKWTGSKVGIVELAYALHTHNVFNNGACELKDIVAFFSKSFDIDLTQFHRTFFEISSRKAERTKFLSALRESLVKRMENAEKH